MKQKELAAALKCIVILCLLAGIGLCGVLLPMYGATIAKVDVEYAWLFWPCLAGLWALCVPVLIVLALVWQMAGRIGADNSFCVENAQALKWICALAVLATGLCLVGGLALAVILRGLPPFLLLLCAAVMLVGAAIAVVSAVLSHLIQKAADLKADQDLTI